MKKIDPIVAALVMAGACVGTWAITTNHWITEIKHIRPLHESDPEESRPLIDKFGLARNSRGLEELIVRDFFQDRRGGTFLDVGANHYQDESNTYYLETALGWSGIAVEPLAEFAAGYAKHRPKTRFVAAFASDASNGTIAFFVPTAGQKLMASSTAGYASGQTQETTVPTTTLIAVLEQAGIARLDFMSMDIELAEPQALKGLDLTRFGPSLVCIESHEAVRQQILDFFHRNGYVVVGKYLRSDTRNLWFRPAVE
jgi:FkbM family methyltransferase